MKALAALIQGRDPLREIGKRDICISVKSNSYVCYVLAIRMFFPSLLFLFILFHLIFATRFEHQTKTGHYENSFILKCFTSRP